MNKKSQKYYILQRISTDRKYIITFSVDEKGATIPMTETIRWVKEDVEAEKAP